MQPRTSPRFDADRLSALLEHQPAQAAKAILAAAGQGVVPAQRLLGRILLDGCGIEQDERLARHWLAVAARAGDAKAHNLLGRCLEHGWGGEVALSQAAVHYAQAADAGSDWGMYNLGNLLATGRGLPADQALALTCFEKAAQRGHAKSMNVYGRYLEQGIAVAASPLRAARWYRRAAEAGDFRGMFSLALVLASRGEMGEASRWFEQARVEGTTAFLRSALAQLQEAGPQLTSFAARYAQALEGRED